MQVNFSVNYPVDFSRRSWNNVAVSNRLQLNFKVNFFFFLDWLPSLRRASTDFHLSWNCCRLKTQSVGIWIKWHIDLSLTLSSEWTIQYLTFNIWILRLMYCWFIYYYFFFFFACCQFPNQNFAVDLEVEIQLRPRWLNQLNWYQLIYDLNSKKEKKNDTIGLKLSDRWQDPDKRLRWRVLQPWEISIDGCDYGYDEAGIGIKSVWLFGFGGFVDCFPVGRWNDSVPVAHNGRSRFRKWSIDRPHRTGLHHFHLACNTIQLPFLFAWYFPFLLLFLALIIIVIIILVLLLYSSVA